MYKGSNHTSKTVFDLNINLLCPREESLQFFYSNLSFSNFLCAFFALKCTSLLHAYSYAFRMKIF